MNFKKINDKIQVTEIFQNLKQIIYYYCSLFFNLHQTFILRAKKYYYIISDFMCGRIFQTLPLNRLIAIARAAAVTNSESYNVSYNICPTTFIPAIRINKRFAAESQPKETHEIVNEQNVQQEKQQDKNKQEIVESDQNKQLIFMKWGHKTKHNFIINGRVEELTQKHTFMKIIQNRCVVVMEGYFQWNQKKQPFMFKPKNADHFLVAALYSDENQIVILTKDATDELKKVHHRMPIILNNEDVETWLNPDNTKHIARIIQNSFLKKQKQIWKNVGFTKLAPHVNSIKQKSIKCLMTIEQYKKQLDRNGLMRFWKKPPAVEQVGKEGEVLTQKSSQKVTTETTQTTQNKKQEQLQTKPKRDILKDSQQ